VVSDEFHSERYRTHRSPVISYEFRQHTPTSPPVTLLQIITSGYGLSTS